jgi:hypothetical protein
MTPPPRRPHGQMPTAASGSAGATTSGNPAHRRRRHRLHLNCTGTGSPTVVLEPGHGEVSSAMGWIAPAVSQDTRVCVYDRAGHGWSEPRRRSPGRSGNSSRPAHAARPGTHPWTLRTRRSLIWRPLCPHLRRHLLRPGRRPRAAGLHRTQPGRGPTRQGRVLRPHRSHLNTAVATAHLGAARLIPDSYDSLPARSRDEARATVSTARSAESYLNELRAGAAATRQAAAFSDFAGKPLIVVTAGRGNDAPWQAAQKKLATLSTNSRHRVVPDATHASLYLDQTHSAAASQAIRDVVEAVRSDKALPPN